MRLSISLRSGAAPIAEQLRRQGLHLPEGSRLAECVEALGLLEAEGVLLRSEAKAPRQRLVAMVEREARTIT